MTEDTRHEIIVENLACLSSEKGDLPKAKRESVYLCLRSVSELEISFLFFFFRNLFFFFLAPKQSL